MSQLLCHLPHALIACRYATNEDSSQICMRDEQSPSFGTTARNGDANDDDADDG